MKIGNFLNFSIKNLGLKIIHRESINKMPLFTRPIEELLSYIFSRLNKGIFLDELDHKHFQAKVSEGLYILKDLKLNPLTINQNLSESSLHLKSASISRVHIRLPSLIKINHNPVSVQMGDVVIELCSAGESGSPVILNQNAKNPSDQQQASQQNVGIFTKTIGNIISNITFEINMIKIRIRAHPNDSDFIQITINKASLKKDLSDNKASIVRSARIEGFRISVTQNDAEVYEPSDYSHIAFIEHPINLRIFITNEMLLLEGDVAKINALICMEQLKVIVNIFSRLRKSTLVINEESVLMETYREIKEEIIESIEPESKVEIRKKSMKFRLKAINVALLLEESEGFKKRWDYQDGAYPGVPHSHLLIYFNDSAITQFLSTDIKVKNFGVKYCHLANNPALESSSIYQSAKQSFFSEFFKPKVGNFDFWAVDINKQHFCIKNVIEFYKSRDDLPSSPGYVLPTIKEDISIKKSQNDFKIKLATMKCHLDLILISELENLIYSLDFNGNSNNGSIFSFLVSLPSFQIDYQQHDNNSSENGFCCCSQSNWKLMGILKKIKIMGNNNDILANSKEFDVYITSETELINIMKIPDIKYERISQSQEEIIIEEQKVETHERYYVPGQGRVSFPKNTKISEIYSENDDYRFRFDPKKRNEAEENRSKKSVNYINRISASYLEIQINSFSLQQLVYFIPTNLKKPISTKKSPSYWEISIKRSIINLSSTDNSLWFPNSPRQYSTTSFYTPNSSISNTINYAANPHSSPIISIILISIEAYVFKNCYLNRENYIVAAAKKGEGTYLEKELLRPVGDAAIEIIFEKTNENSEFNFNLTDFAIFAQDLRRISRFLKGFDVQIPKKDEKYSKINIFLQNIVIDYATDDGKLLSFIEDWHISSVVGSAISSAYYLSLGTFRVYLQSALGFKVDDIYFKKPLKWTIFDPILKSKGFVLVFSLDSFELYGTKIRSNTEETGEEPFFPTEECLIGSHNCTAITSNIFISENMKNCHRNSDMLDLYINVGCIIMHLCKDSISLLNSFFDFKGEEEPPEMLRKDSDLSSDDSDTYPVSVIGLMIDPKDSIRIKNINIQDYLSPEFKPKLLKNKFDNKIMALPNITKFIHTHTKLPKNPSKNTSNSNFHRLRTYHGTPSLKLSLSIFYFSINLYSGNDFSYKARSGTKRNLSSFIQFKIDEIGFTFARFPKILHFSWIVSISIGDIEIHDFIKDTSVKKMLKIDNINKSPLTDFFQTKVTCAWPRPEYSIDQELIIYIKLLPVKLNIDQNCVDFFLDLFNWKPEEQTLMRRTAALPDDAAIIQKPKAQLFIQKFIIEPIEINLDYIPHAVGGRYPGANVLNAFQIEEFNFCLSRIEMIGVKDIHQALIKTWKLWYQHIVDNEIIRLLSNIGPMKAIKNVSGAIYEFVCVDWSSDPNSEGAKIALVKLIKTLSVESLKIVETFMSGTYTIVQGCGNAAGLKMPSRQAIVRPLRDAQHIFKGI
ncbi:unnamed protein product [Blepharisma stoltei]|uniref:Autophagy-related protein 2 n=1 Tax=Blepharisma stoltei TaxID=1481888 RepID=A0AAU9IYT0_9CILI|nr:unnamed protein product [Blepharisma stoltei]